MSYQAYGNEQGQQSGYGQYNPYSQQQDAFGQPAGGYGNTGAYGAATNQQPLTATSSRYDDDVERRGGAGEHNQQQTGRYGQQEAGGYGMPQQQEGGYEMTSVNGGNRNDPNRILNECRAIDRAIDEIEDELTQLTGLRTRFLGATDTSNQNPVTKEVETLNTRIMIKYRGLVDRVKTLKADSESGNPRNSAQVGKVDRRLKAALQHAQEVDKEYRNRSQERAARQYRIVRPDASDAEVQEAIENPSNQQVFSSALLQSDRRGHAQQVAQNVRSRQEAIQKIERDMIILAELFQDLDTAVIQQEAAVTKIEQKAEVVNDHVVKANTELDGAVTKARSARRKKFYCLGIALLIVIIIVVVVVVVVEVLNNQKKP